MDSLPEREREKETRESDILSPLLLCCYRGAPPTEEAVVDVE